MGKLNEMSRLYRESLLAMQAELTSLMEFSFEFKGEESSQRLTEARELITKELETTNG